MERLPTGHRQRRWCVRGELDRCDERQFGLRHIGWWTGGDAGNTGAGTATTTPGGPGSGNAGAGDSGTITVAGGNGYTPTAGNCGGGGCGGGTFVIYTLAAWSSTGTAARLAVSAGQGLELVPLERAATRALPSTTCSSKRSRGSRQ